MNIADKISYEEELAKGEYISGRVEDITREGQQIVRMENNLPLTECLLCSRNHGRGISLHNPLR